MYFKFIPKRKNSFAKILLTNVVSVPIGKSSRISIDDRPRTQEPIPSVYRRTVPLDIVRIFLRIIGQSAISTATAVVMISMVLHKITKPYCSHTV